MVGAKAQPTTLLLPIIQKRKNVFVRTGAWVRRILFDSAPKSKARGVTYVDATGEEILPARLSPLPFFLDLQQHSPAAALRHR